MSELNEIKYHLPPITRAIVFSPHPDDETLACGGTMALYRDAIDFTVVALSLGEAVNIPEENKAGLRKKEFEEAMDVIRVKDRIVLGIPDGKFEEHSEDLAKKMKEICLRINPQLIFIPSPLDLHADHRATALAAIRLVESFRSIKLAFYEVYHPVRFNTLLDITASLETKRKALLKYHYSMLKREEVFISSVLSLNRFRSLFTLTDSHYEAFFIPDSAELSEILRWLTFSSQTQSPEEQLLDSLRNGDVWMKALRDCETEAAALKERIVHLEGSLDEQSKLLSLLQERGMRGKGFFGKILSRCIRK